jgi:hemerythrin superfamily protein
VNRSIDAEIRFESRVKTRLNNVNDFTETRIQRDYERHQEQCLRYWQSINEDKEQYWGVLKELYGDFPKDLFQRLMAVEYQQTF